VSPVLAIIALCVAAVGVLSAAGLLDHADAAVVRYGAGRWHRLCEPVRRYRRVSGAHYPRQAETMFASDSAGLVTPACVAIVGVVIIFHCA
jgi:hypothetical protein